MKNRQLLILIISLFSTCISYANGKDSVKTLDIVERSLQREQYYLLFSKVPSLLREWDNEDYAFISSGYSNEQGSYTHPQLLFSKNLIDIKTESIKSIPTKGLRFFGGVSYTNGNAQTGDWNLSYYLPSNGSPYYYMVEQAGTWKTQSYDFNVAMQKNLSKRVSAGVSIKYLGDLHFRTFDTRNENYILDIQVLPSITVSFGEKNLASIGLVFNRIKNSSDIRNKYQHGTEPERYHLFFNEGLGTWDNSPSVMNMIDVKYGLMTSLRRIIERGSLDFIYTINYGKEDWALKSFSTLLDRKKDIVKYSYFEQDLSLRLIKGSESGRWISNLDVKNIIGTGSLYKESAALFQDNYDYLKVRANLNVAYLKDNSLLKRVWANINFDNSGQNDYNYGHTIDYNNLEGTIAADIALRHVGKFNFSIGGLASYKMNLTAQHNPIAAATNFYTTSIAVPAFAYLTSDYYRLGLNLGADFHLKGSQMLEIAVRSDLIKPIKINDYENFAKFSLDDKYLNISVNLFFYF